MEQTTEQIRTSKTYIPVRGYHLDAFNHVNNARYLEFLEEARWAHFEASDEWGKMLRQGLAPVIVHYDISYKYPATLGQILEVHTSFESAGNTSMAIRQKIYLKGTDTLVINAKVTFVLFDQKTEQAVTISEDLVERMKS
ncbi:thioesterase family protein [Algivirga pacifica]|uniref:YbgC/FadM family acyl-CoA thioesterase n=1 Tax=Algivirga pacifica TaxID=1162670 RepID=A0ABP9DKR6_9BACT